MTCLECKHFKRLKDGQKGSIKGSCKLKCSVSYQDWRYGRQKACKTYFELKRREQMKFLAILDESEKIDLEEKGLIKESKPIFKEMLVGKDGQSVYITQEHLNCLIEYSQRKAIEQELKRREHFFDDMKLFEDKVSEMKGEKKDGL